MKKIEFFGASGGEVTGSNYLITADDDNQVLVDFGMFQGDKEIQKRNFEPLAFNAQGLQAVFLTHAHLDHCGRLPLLIYGGFQGKIYMTAPTRRFVEIILEDSARIAEKDQVQSPLYTQEEVWKVLKMIEIVKYDVEVNVGSFKGVFKDAGHILGSSSIVLTDVSGDKPESIVFSGDLGNTPQPLVKPTQYIDQADYVVMETTYGDSTHPKEDPAQIIQDEINAVEQSGGTLLIPAFAIERTQEVLHTIHHLKAEGKVKADTPVFLDSPMGIDVTAVYLDFKDFYSEELQNHPDIPFNFESLLITYEGWESRKIKEEPGAKVIIAGSGMMSGGRIMHHIINYLSDPKTRVLFVGYQAEETTGRKVLEGVQQVTVEDRKGVKTVPVRAHINEIKTLSSHADQPRLLTWLGHIKGVKKVFLTHGELPQQQAFQELVKTELKIQDVSLPKQGEEYSLN